MTKMKAYKYAFEAITDDVSEQNDLIFRSDLLMKVIDLIEEAEPEQLDKIKASVLYSIKCGKLNELTANRLIEVAAFLGYRVLSTVERIDKMDDET
ncbi:hypothetical protein EVB55_242 [Rhizobium phage RHph_Y68]|uniref:Uncharacterized protein n=1 Tax=Rhizobium phage RHph_Y68 TaxID=2509787 RepID=A0A7S5QY80_9CAUD|nr:hypothetical protein PP934_gp242 [Rhizobium phage RHph_Y68]QIG68177.1 hypothetical protein EVB55_242 [Rhizobium phage RHph_Y68]